MKTRMVSLFVASILSVIACADPAMVEKVDSQELQSVVTEAAQVDEIKNFSSGQCSVVCSLPDLASNDNKK